MNPENIVYMARVNAGHWLIRKAGKIVSRLAVTAEHQQAIKAEIVAIGRRLYEEACREPQPEVTHEPGGDYQLGLYANAVVELDASVEMWFIENDYNHKFTPEQTVRRWRDHLSYCEGREQQ